MKYIVTLNGKNYEVEVEETEAVLLSVQDAVPAAAPVSAPAVPAAAPGKPTVTDGTQVVSPMPGTILKVNASVGQAVKAGETLFVLEAMKMENEIAAPADGTIKQLLVSQGSSVATDDVLAVL